MAVYKYAGFGRRLVAFSIDNIIINIVFLILIIIISTAFILGSLSGDINTLITNLTNPAQLTFIALLVTAFYIILSLAYFTYFHGIKGRTPGKMLLGLQVLSAQGTPIGFGIAFLRAVGYLVSSLLFTIPLGFIWAAFDQRKQGWHDKIAGTVVIIRHDESEADGLTIPERQPVFAVPQAADRQSQISTQAMVEPESPVTGEKQAKSDQP